MAKLLCGPQQKETSANSVAGVELHCPLTIHQPSNCLARRIDAPPCRTFFHYRRAPGCLRKSRVAPPEVVFRSAEGSFSCRKRVTRRPEVARCLPEVVFPGTEAMFHATEAVIAHRKLFFIRRKRCIAPEKARAMPRKLRAMTDESVSASRKRWVIRVE
jgi:hypothetical protein